MGMTKEKTKTKKRLKKKAIVFIVLLLIFLFSLIKVGMFYLDAKKNKQVNENIFQEVTKTEKIINEEGEETEVFSVDFSKLLEKNEDTKGWIRMNQDKISYPIVQAEDNEYYLERSFDKKKNSLGSIFMDYRNTSWEDQNVVIYGHNGSDKSMFGYLREIFDKNYFDAPENQIIEIIGEDNKSNFYEIFSYYVIEAEEYYITTSFANNSSYLDFLSTIKNRSYKNFHVSLNASDKIITLSTCNGSGETPKRTVIHARLMQEE